ncbi:CheR family methyltransferase [Xanthobacter pseudotagetidis]|uniref:CheR family methyltransferase n=1 Tax=Xanthobacter pseudotagetidis TaxID=3119911 RepID=UPI00372ADF21
MALPDRFDRHLKPALDRVRDLLEGPGGRPAWLELEAQPWSAPAWQEVIKRVTVRETSFFRQRTWWDSLIEAALRPLVAARRRDGSRRLRCLSVGCASGEEPYSLAIILEGLIGLEAGWTVEIVGLDLCAAALEGARAGVYDMRAIREVSPEDRARWFRPAGRAHVALDARLRGKVDFRLFNLADAAAAGPEGAAAGALAGPADFVICRNMLIHMEPSLQPAFARALCALVREGGMLAVSPVEATASWFAPLRLLTVGHAILFVNEGRKAATAARTAFRSAAAESATAAPRAHPSEGAEPAAAPRRKAAAHEDADPLQRARLLADLGLLQEARHLCGQMLATRPEARLLMALVCQALADIPAAEAAARHSLAAAPGAAAAHYVDAIVQLRKGETERARRALGEAVRLLDMDAGGNLVGRQLGIEAGHIRQAARRLGALPAEGGGRARPV